MKKLLYISSMTVLVFTVLYLLHENIFAEWRGHQLNFKNQLEAINKGESDTDAFKVKLRQIYLPEIGRVDRCVSCHVAMEDPRFKDAENPLKTHPGSYLDDHDIEQFGCTICHDGQGRAIAWEDAAANVKGKHWEKPLVRGEFLEANCYRCHTDSLKETAVYNQGKELFDNNGCLCCHQRDGMGGYLSTEFRGLGDESFHMKYPVKDFDDEITDLFNDNTNIAYIYEAIRYPKVQPDDSVMFDNEFSHEDSLALTVYLKSLVNTHASIPKAPVEPKALPSLLEKGQGYFQLACTACHGKDGQGGIESPNYVKDVMPTLNVIAERMFLYDEEDAGTFIETIDQFGDLPLADPPPDIPRFNVVKAQYKSIYDVILNGNPGGKKDPEGATPFNMPSWRSSIPEKDVPAIIAYLVELYDYEEYW